MADTGFNYAGTVEAVSGGGAGSLNWTNPTNAAGSPDAVYATCGGAGSLLPSVQLVIDGIFSGDNQPQQSLNMTTPTDVTFGGSDALWGLTLSDTDINITDFGVRFYVSGGAEVSINIKATNYGFNIPSGATIDGIEVVIRGYYTTSRFGSIPYIDSVGIKVYYTDGSGGTTTKPNYYYAQQ